MRRQALYSSSRSGVPGQNASPVAEPEATQPAPAAQAARSRFSAASPKLLWTSIVILAALLVFSISLGLRPPPRKLTQDDINAAVLKTLETKTIPSEYARAYEKVRPSVVRVVSYVKKSRLKEESPTPPKGGAKPKPLGPAAAEADKTGPDDDVENGVGTGVVIVDKGIILTNLHVVSGADRIMVTFSDGLESQAVITGVQPENDLAVLQASKIPDDMIAATMRSTGDLASGDKVLAVGFPFGIGPSLRAASFLG